MAEDIKCRTEMGLNPEACVWLGSGNQSTLVKVLKRSWFLLNVS